MAGPDGTQNGPGERSRHARILLATAARVSSHSPRCHPCAAHPHTTDSLRCVCARARRDLVCSPALQLEPQTELQLPLWLAEPLSRRQHVDLQLPRFYGTNYRNALRADAAHLNLCSQSAYYFEVGVQLAQLLDDESELGGQLLGGFASRFHALIDPSLSVTSRLDSNSIVEKLTLREKQIFDAGRDASEQYNTWKAEKTRGRIEQSALVGAQKKGQRNKKRARENTSQQQQQ